MFSRRSGVALLTLMTAVTFAACSGEGTPDSTGIGSPSARPTSAHPIPTSAPASTPVPCASTSIRTRPRAPVGATADYTVESLPVDVVGGAGLGINDHGRVIGTGATRKPGQDWEHFGFVWDDESGLCDLGWDTWPKSINSAGLVAGSIHLDDEDSGRPFLFEPSTGLRDIGRPKGWTRFTMATLNDVGQFAGTAGKGGDEEETSEAYLWDPVTGWTGFGRRSWAQDLNDAGQLLVNVGGADEAVYDHHLFLWTAGTTATDLGDGDYGMLNSLGQAAWGRYDQESFKEQVYLWDPQTATRTNVVTGRATGLNDQGQVVGEVAGIDDPWDIRAFVWSARDGLTDLGTLPGADWATALGINEQGQVVGFSGTGAPGEPDWFHAFVWDQGAGMRDLGTLGKTENSVAAAINEAGQIVGRSSKESDPWGAGTVVIWRPT